MKARQASNDTFKEHPPSTEQFIAWEVPLPDTWVLILNSGKGFFLFDGLGFVCFSLVHSFHG